jgi:hypothetical protein
MKMVLTPEQQIFMMNLIFAMVTHFAHFEKVAMFSESSRPKVCTEENIETVQLNVKCKTNPNYLSGNCRSRLSYQCQLLKELFEKMLILDNSATAERYRNNILDVFITQLQLAQGYFNKTGLQHGRLFVICAS